MNEQDKWANLANGLAQLAAKTDFKKVNLHTGLGLVASAAPFWFSFLSQSQQVLSAIIAGGLTSAISAIASTRKSTPQGVDSTQEKS